MAMNQLSPCRASNRSISFHLNVQLKDKNKGLLSWIREGRHAYAHISYPLERNSTSLLEMQNQYHSEQLWLKLIQVNSTTWWIFALIHFSLGADWFWSRHACPGVNPDLNILSHYRKHQHESCRERGDKRRGTSTQTAKVSQATWEKSESAVYLEEFASTSEYRKLWSKDGSRLTSVSSVKL